MTRRRRVRHNSLLSPEKLRDAAKKAMDREGLTQAETAEIIGAAQSHVGAAQGAKYVERASINARIIDALSPFNAEREVLYRVRRKGKA